MEIRLATPRRNGYGDSVKRFQGEIDSRPGALDAARTLNVLLSFAQFEREVTGERMRDKIAASKRKGLWMGGVAPLGYDLRDRRLVVNHAEASIVKLIYKRYLELGWVRLLKDDLDRRGIVSKVRVSRKGIASGGRSLSRGALYELLSNPIYIGEIRHCQERHRGQHEPILERDVWEKVQERLSDHARRDRQSMTQLHRACWPGNCSTTTANRSTRR
jgi:site-specific DNA recombinase